MNKLSCIFMLCLGVLTGCDGDNDNDGLGNLNSSTIRPCKLDMTGVEGFVVTSNTSNDRSTRADYDGDGTEGGYSLYTIDANGELHLSIFYFEMMGNEDGESNEQGAEVMTELSNALQIVPSLVADLGKYILFSGCKYQIITSGLSDKAQSICESFLQYNWGWEENVFMIRKSDGALFDLSHQPIFSYFYFNGGDQWFFNEYYTGTFNSVTGGSENWCYIPSYTYITSVKNNLFVRSYDPWQISRIEDRGDSVRVKQMTHGYSSIGFHRTLALRNFAIDEEENIYEFFGVANPAERPSNGAELDIYYANGRFNVYNFSDFKSNLHNHSYRHFFDLVIDESGTPYIFLYYPDQESSETWKVYFLSAYMEKGNVSVCGEGVINSDNYHLGEGSHFGEYPHPYHYLGCYNNCFNWYVPSRSRSFSPDEVISYNKSTNKWSSKTISSGLMQIITDDYDAWINEKKCYGANIKGNTIEVTEIDIASETSRTYTFTVDLSFIISPSYSIRMMQDVPYLAIDGRNVADGTGVSFMINLVNGDNNSTFATDNRSVVSFFRIN